MTYTLKSYVEERDKAWSRPETVFTAEAISGIRAVLIQPGGLSGEELDRAVKLTLDFASVVGMDAQSAGVVIADAVKPTGSTEKLSRYGIILDDEVSEGDRVAAVLDAVAKRFSL